MPALRLAPLVLALVVATTLLQSAAHAQEEDWAHAAWLDDRFLVRWTPGPEDITFELTVATLGYVGFGISPDGRMWGSDLVIGWFLPCSIVVAGEILCSVGNFALP
ncbi:hypothetical protein B566_EDAN009142 [Ephemera danica]|nr:hypothetical protein B566_EDAN009142 [Ephemera danica]